MVSVTNGVINGVGMIRESIGSEMEIVLGGYSEIWRLLGDFGGY